jgi:dTDP-4-amino-4,6-dideoxygalactose transaminase
VNIPFADLKTQYQQHKNEFDEAIQAVLNETNFIKGHQIKQFEEEFAELCESKHCVAVANGTDAIYISLKSLDRPWR